MVLKMVMILMMRLMMMVVMMFTLSSISSGSRIPAQANYEGETPLKSGEQSRHLITTPRTQTCETNYISEEIYNGFLKSLECILMIQTLIKVQSGQCWHCIVSSDLIFLYFDKIALLMQENAFFYYVPD